MNMDATYSSPLKPLAIDVDTIANSPRTIKLLAAMAGVLPRQLGYRIADLVAAGIAGRRHSRLTRAVRANQWVVSGETLAGRALDQLVGTTLRNSARSVFDLYHYIHDPEAAGRAIVLEIAVQRLLQRSEFEGRGLMVAGIHLSSFDLCLRWFSRQGIRPLVITIPELEGGRRTEYEMRRQMGMNLVPATVAGLRQALRHLQNGGVVLTGVDRPIPEPRIMPRFFGRPAAVPVPHIGLAMRAGVPVVVLAAILEQDGRYHIHGSDPLEMESHPDREHATILNAEKVLDAAEGFIRRAPQQWAVPLPVWPSVTVPA